VAEQFYTRRKGMRGGEREREGAVAVRERKVSN